MVAKSSDSSAKPPTRRRRRVRTNDDDAADSSSKDDVKDVIFDESDDAPPPKRKKATRRKKAAAKKKVADEAPAEPVADDEPAEPKPRRRRRRAAAAEDDVSPADVQESSAEDSGPSREERAEQDRQERQDNREQENASSDSDDDHRPRRRRRRRRRSGGGGGEGGFNSGGHNNHQGGGNQRGGRRRRGRGGRDRDGGRHGGRDRVRSVAPSNEVIEGTIDGVLELHPKGYGFLRNPEKNYVAQESDPFVPSSLVEKYRLREGVMIRGDVGPGVRNQGPRLKEVELIDSLEPEAYGEIKDFDELTPVTPYQHIRLETGPKPVTMRVMDLLTPVGKGQRALLVAPPRTGKTMLLQDIADAVSKNHPEMHLMVLLIDERPEEVTEMTRCVNGEVIASSMDRDVESHVRMSQLMIERAKRMAETGKDVFILMDSITRMARAFNKWSGGGGGGRHSGTMSGGLHVKALDIPKKLFGTARQFDEGGSITIVATALIETGGRMDDVIFQEFKGTGNMELVLSRDLADRRIWPAIDITRSGTRHEEKLFAEEALDSVIMLRRSLISLSPVEAMEQLTRTLDRFPTNTEFLQKVKAIL